MPQSSIRQYFVSKLERIKANYLPDLLLKRKSEVVRKNQEEEIRQAFLDYQLRARRCVTPDDFQNIYRDLRRRVTETKEKMENGFQ